MHNVHLQSQHSGECNGTDILPGAINHSQPGVEMTDDKTAKRHAPGNIALRFVSSMVGKSLNHTKVNHRSLLDLAKDPSTTSPHFLAAARAHPEELVMTDDSDQTSHVRTNPTRGFDRYNSFMEDVVTGVTGGFTAGFDSAANTDDEKGMTPVHLFLARAADLTFYEIFTLYELEQNCFVRLSTLNRTPVHYLLEHNTCFSADVLDALHKCDSKFLLRLDRKYNTPLDRYFKRNWKSKMKVTDQVVRFLCSQPGSWGINALVHSADAYRSHSTRFSLNSGLGSFSQENAAPNANSNQSNDQQAELPKKYRKFLTGSPWELERFVRELMTEGDAESIIANIKFLFVLLPLRSPTKYGLSSTQGVQLVTRIINTISNVFALERGEKSEAFKRIWLRAFADCAMYAILDEGLLSGMLSNPPSKEILEALSVTPLIQTVLSFKFRSGPVLIFYGELLLFVFMCTLVLGSILAPMTSLVTVALGLCATAYFSVREIHHMLDARSKEIELFIEGASKVQSRRRSSGANGGFRQYNQMSFAEPTTPTPTSRTPQPQNWRQNANFRRMSVDLFGTMDSEGDRIELATESADQEKCAPVSGDLDDEDNERVIHSMMDARLRKFSYFITVYLGLSEAWRQNPFNWINLGALLSTWITLLNSALISITNLTNPQYFESHRKLELLGLGKSALVTINVICVSFLGLRALGYLRGTGIKMATFVLMLQEISWNVDVFLVVLGLILILFAALYHIMLVGESLEDDEWSSFQDSLWKVWGYAVGEIDDTAFPTTSSYLLFTAFALTIVIIMMNILIAIVSDSYTDAMERSEPLFWRARVDLIAEYEPLLPQLKDITPGLMTLTESNNHRAQIPPTWQYRTLQFQESAVATSIVLGIVLFEMIFVGNLREREDTYREQTSANYNYEPSFYWGLGVSAIFLAEILLRYYTWSHTVAQIEAQKLSVRSQDDARSPAVAASKLLGGFFSNKFRLLDSLLVVLDLFLFALEIILVNSKVDAKASSKLARLLRLVRSTKWLGRLKVLRSLRFLHRLGVILRKFGQPTRQKVRESLRQAMRTLEEAADGWEDSSTDVSERIKADLGRNTSKVLEAIDKRASGSLESDNDGNDIISTVRPLINDLATRLESSEATLSMLLDKMNALESFVVRSKSEPVSPAHNAESSSLHAKLDGASKARSQENAVKDATALDALCGLPEDGRVGKLGVTLKVEGSEKEQDSTSINHEDSPGISASTTEACL